MTTITDTHNQALASFLAQGNTLTANQARKEIGTARLAARIYDLKKAGFKIERKMVPTNTGVKVAQYRLAKNSRKQLPKLKAVKRTLVAA